MADPKNKKTDDKDDDTPAPATGDAAVAEKANITEGELHALRDNAGVDQLPGHEANVLAYELSPEGKQFIKDEKERNEAAQKQAEAENGPDEGAEALNKALKSKK
jgi:hypothetical protein